MDVEAQQRFPKFEFLGDAVPYIDRIFNIIDHIHLFEDFEREEIAFLAPYFSCYKAPAGAEIIREGDHGDFMLLVLEGSVDIVKFDAELSVTVRVGHAGLGKILGEMSLVDGEPRFASCLAMSPLLFAVLDRDSLSRIIADAPHVGIKLLMQLIVLLNQRLRIASGDLMRCLGKIKAPKSQGISP